MSMPDFEYLSPATIEEALSLLSRHGAAARIMAGGTDLLLRLERAQPAPEFVIGLKRVTELRFIRHDSRRGLYIGAMTRLSEVLEHPLIREHYPAIASAAAATATVQIRNMATMAGNLCNASPCADSAPTLIARGARVELVRPGGNRWVQIEEFFTGPGATVLAPDEILRQIHVPPPPKRSGASFQSLSARTRVDISAVSVAAMLTMQGRRCLSVRIVLGAVAPVPLRVPRAEAALAGGPLTDASIRKAGTLAARDSKPICDVRASDEYRRKMVAVLTRRAIREAAERASR